MNNITLAKDHMHAGRIRKKGAQMRVDPKTKADWIAQGIATAIEPVQIKDKNTISKKVEAKEVKAPAKPDGKTI